MEGILFLTLIFGFVLAMRYIQYRERMDMLGRGLTPKDYRPMHTSSGTAPTDYTTGTLLPPQYQQQAGAQSPYQPRAGLRSRFSPEAMKQRSDGITTVLVGLGITFGLGTIGWGPWLMPGFIVTFVGVAVLINYYMTTDVAAAPPARPAQPQPPATPPAAYSANTPPAWDAQQWGQPLSTQVPPPPTPYMGEQAKQQQ